MKNIIAFAGSNSKNSINKQLVVYSNSLLDAADSKLLDLNDFEVPMYGIDLENESGIPENANKLNNLLADADGIILSLAEHNGSYAAVFKNIFDWMSRIDKEVFKNKPMLLMTTSPGGRGGAGVLAAAKSTFPHLGGNIIADFSLPSFYDNFKDGNLINKEFDQQLKSAIADFENSL
ncbi:MAG: NAD(P)H-dependent oxidoreductase [Urechidicola sp.]|nr:NAD(P)H-dependent oxidoreductase [Urechidicola sp.]